MGMMIEDAIKYYEEMKKGWYLINPNPLFDLTISTMCKYQKIVEIVSLNDEEFKQCGLKELKEILEVITADGSN